MTQFRDAIASFGAKAKSKLNNPAARGEPEDQLRSPFEELVQSMADLCRLPKGKVVAVGETALRHLKTRPDYSITVQGTLTGFVELKSPGKGADPRKFKDVHDKAQWDRLRSLPNLLYTDGNSFSLWQDGQLALPVILVDGDIETAGAKLDAPPELLGLFERFFGWNPIPPRTAKELAETSARLCRLLRDEVAEQLDERNESLVGLRADWRKLLFPEATDEQFADSYAQAVTFGLLMARAQGVSLAAGLQEAAKELGRSSSLIGAALRILTEDLAGDAGLKTSIGTLTRVLDVVDWRKISKGKADAWLYFYENFLDVYDHDLRKQTGSYYTPPEVVREMVRLVDAVLRSRFGRADGIAAADVTIADPAVGTGTFLLGILERIEQIITGPGGEGEGAVAGKISQAIGRLIAFELQLGPFAVAQLRLTAEIARLAPAGRTPPLRMYVTDTLGNPDEEQEWLPHGPQYKAISESRKLANKIKRDEPITVVIGNPPYKEKAKAKGGWVESGGANTKAPLLDWIPPADWGISAHAKHLRNLYVYFWRWATWKVFDHAPGQGIVCFITVAGFLNGPGFQRMREYLRQKADDIWVIDCSPEGHQPEVATRIFQCVQQPVCIVLASRSPGKKAEVPAALHFTALPKGHRTAKFGALAAVHLEGPNWQPGPKEWRAPFLPAAVGAWSKFVPLDRVFRYSGAGVMPGRTWVIAPDSQSLLDRWDRLVTENDPGQKEALFLPHLKDNGLGDRHVNKRLAQGLANHEERLLPISEDQGPCVNPCRYAFRSFDRQWIIPDNRVINRPNPELWRMHSAQQVYLTAPDDRSPTAGPALTFTADTPDLHHYNGRGGRVFPLWHDAESSESNVLPGVLVELTKTYGTSVSGEDVMAYVAAVLAHPAFTTRFAGDLIQPGLRVPFTAEPGLFGEAADLGRTVIWLHTYGERFADPSKERPKSLPRLSPENAPRIPAAGAIPADPDRMPDEIDYDPATRRLKIGAGYVEGVSARVWGYEVSGKQVLRQWFSYRKANRERPIIGDRRPPSKLGEIQPDHWLPEYTTDLSQLLHVLGRIVELEPLQANLLERICASGLLGESELSKAGALDRPEPGKKKSTPGAGASEKADRQVTMVLPDSAPAGGSGTTKAEVRSGGKASGADGDQQLAGSSGDRGGADSPRPTAGNAGGGERRGSGARKTRT